MKKNRYEALSPRSLMLDHRNPRLAPGSGPLSERQIIEQLVLHENVVELAKIIAGNGYFPSEPVVVVVEGGKKYVVEGNRRLAACKILLDPTLAPETHQQRFRTIAASSPHVQNLGTIPAVMFASREAAYPLIIARHTNTQIEKWRPQMQAHFYANLVESGLSIEEISKQAQVPANDIRGALHSFGLYAMACRLDVPAAEKVRDPHRFELSTLQRVFESEEARDLFGLVFSEDGQITGTIEEAEFARGFAKVVNDIAEKEQDSRTLHSQEKVLEYLENLAEKPDKKKRGKFDSKSFLQGTPKRRSIAKSRAKKTEKITSIGRGLIPRQFPCGVLNNRVQSLVKELKKLSLKDFPNATAFMFRCLLEISAYCYLDSRRHIDVMRKEYLADIAKKNAGRPPERRIPVHPDWVPELSVMLKRLSEPTHSLLKPHTARALKRVMIDEEGLFALNLSTHNPTYHPSETHLRQAWRILEEYFREVLT
jgi:hypothetical protein